MTETTFIYGLIDPLTQELRYVGKANDLKRRLICHIRDAKIGNGHKDNWIKSLLAIGLRPEIFDIESVPYFDWQDSERFWISYFRFVGCRLINSTDGGEGWKNPSREARRAFSEKRSQLARQFNALHPEMLQRLHESNRGRKRTGEFKKMIGEMNRQRVWTDGAKERNRQRMKALGKDNPLFRSSVREKQKEMMRSNNPMRSKEARQKVSNFMRSDKSPMRRLEVRKKNSESHKGQVPWNKGKKQSREHQLINSESHKGQIPWNKGKKKSSE